MTGTHAAANSNDSVAALRDWQAVRGSADVQFAPANFQPLQPAKPPAWLEAIGKALENLFRPLGEALGMGWPTMRWVLLGLVVLVLLYLVWRMLAPLVEARRLAADEAESPWAPRREAALSLLEESDRLAGEGRFDEAVHLLLRRSVGQIAESRPDWLGPASTAREIAVLPGLPAAPRAAFALIAARVERSLFALIPLGPDDWQAARAAYADFALAELRA